MLLLSRQNNIQNKEAKNVKRQTKQQCRCAYISASPCQGHENFSHGPLFSTSGRRRKRWSVQATMFQAILMAYDPSASLKDRFANARQCLVEMFPNRRRPGATYQGLVKAVVRLPDEIREQLQQHLCQEHKKVAGDSWRVRGWVAFAADGSRVEVPRTEANQNAFGCAGKEKTGPQLSLTTLYHMGTGLPWRWSIGAGIDSERSQLRSMLSTLPPESLLVLDAGFTGYDLLKEILSRRLSFLVRVGANVTLLTNLGYEFQKKGNIVWLWPQGKRDQKPLRLRLIRVKVKNKHSSGGHDIYLLTNVFDCQSLSDETAAELYKMRWGVEVFFRSFKQTLGCRKLLSRSPKMACEELHWSLIALLLLGLMGVDALVSGKCDPLRLSVAEALRTVRHAMHSNWRWRRRGDIRVLLCKAVKDNYRRHSCKKARDWPYKKRETPPRAPKIRPAKPNEIARAKRIYNAA